jgi:hypothetical protein
MAGFCELAASLRAPVLGILSTKSPTVSGRHLKYSRLRRWRPETGFDPQCVAGAAVLIAAYSDIPDRLLHAGCRRAVPNASASGRIADAPAAMSPAPRAVRDVELAALEHVRPVEPGKQFRLQKPHAAAGNARIEREARRHFATVGELGEHDLAIGNG